MTREIIDSNQETMESLNALYPSVVLNLEILAEECAEIIQAKAKIIRFGLHNTRPGETGEAEASNIEKFCTEIGQLQAMVDILISNGVVLEEVVRRGYINKINKLRRFYDNPAG